MSEGPSQPRLLVADDAPTRLGIRMALDGIGRVCAEAATAEEAIAQARREQPDVCLVGLQIPGGGMAAVRGISAAAPDAAIVVIGGSADPDDLLACLRAGALGYVPQSADRDALHRVLQAVREGQAAIPRSMVRDLVEELQTSIAAAGGLTSREAQVLAMLRRGERTSTIAQRLTISPVTVRRHVSSIMRKTGSSDRESLIRIARRTASIGRAIDRS